MDKCSLCIILEETIFGSEWIYVIINTWRGRCKGIRLKHECFQHPRGAFVFYLINCLEYAITFTFLFSYFKVYINKATLKLFFRRKYFISFPQKRQNDVAQKKSVILLQRNRERRRRIYWDPWTSFYRQFSACIFTCACLERVNYLRGTLDLCIIVEVITIGFAES